MIANAQPASASLLPDVIAKCRRWNRKMVVADTTGAELTGGELLTRALVLRRALQRDYLADGQVNVGIILPSTVAGVVVNLALALDRRVSINLNFLLSADSINDCIQRAGIRHVITSQKVLDRLQNPKIEADLIVLEDLAAKVGRRDKAICAFQGMLLPQSQLCRHLSLEKIGNDDLLTILFTSGSTGVPKGVMLTLGNIGSNAAATLSGLDIHDGDVLLGVLPFFHSFGLTATLWMPLLAEAAAVYHTSPLEPDQIANLTRERGVTILLSTPTILRLYTSRIAKEDFASVNMIVTGAEHLPADVADRFEQRFGVRPFEGYGVTETSPVVSFNVPPERARGRAGPLIKDGTIGKPIDGVRVRIAHRETHEDVAIGEDGLLWVKGPNVMAGYLHEPELTASVIEDGWYNTRDIARIDDEGFITITGRDSQFSKIAGEMVPHLLVEATISKVIDASNASTPQAVVTAVPDVRKGERLVVLMVPQQKTPFEITGELQKEGLPTLFIPSPESFVEIEAVPTLPSGKVDLAKVRALALQAFPSPRSS